VNQTGEASPSADAGGGISAVDLEALRHIQERVLWLAVRMIHEANAGHGPKVGGHQASCASVVSILTALYFSCLRSGDRVAVKPHAAPAYHAVQYLLGRLEVDQLKSLRRFGGLQAYPCRNKDPDRVDLSTGSMGLGAAAAAFGALVERYAHHHFGSEERSRFVAIIGDAELDEGNLWEAVAEDHLHGLGNLIWIVDLNRQSLDRVIPGIRAGQLEAIFRATDWQVLEVKYGRRLKEIFTRPGGEALRRRIDDMSNEEYQAMIRLDGQECREQLLTAAEDRGGVKRVLADVSDEDLPPLLSDLGGHDLEELVETLADAAREHDRPTAIFAYTIKGWGLPIAAHPLNHRALLTDEQIADLRARLHVPTDDEWARFPAGSPEDRWCRAAAARLEEPPTRMAVPVLAAEDIPPFLEHRPVRETSTQDALGRLLFRLAEVPRLGERIVTVAPDVAVSTNLGGWINKAGAYSARMVKEYERSPTEVRWESSPRGQHIELGISEMNMFLLLAILGLSEELLGQLLLPIGTVYDPFLLRGLDGLIYGLYSESKFIVVGTPSGVSLSPEGGAHQSTVTPALGIGLPNLISYEPAFAREVEWVILSALRECLDRRHGRATYLRLSTKPIDQTLLDPVLERLGQEELRRQALAGGYRLIDSRYDAPDADPTEMVQIAVCGAMVPEAVAAARKLHEEGVAANVLAITSGDRLYAAVSAQRHREAPPDGEPEHHVAALLPPEERRAPMVTVMDGMSHALTFLGGVFGVPVVPLGVDAFGQSGSREDLYHCYQIDTDSIVAAAYRALDLR